METQIGKEIHPELRFEIGAFQGVLQARLAGAQPSVKSIRRPFGGGDNPMPHASACHSPVVCLTCKAGWALSAVEAHLVYTKVSLFGPIRPDADSYGLTALSSFSAIGKTGPKNPKKDRIFFAGGDKQG